MTNNILSPPTADWSGVKKSQSDLHLFDTGLLSDAVVVCGDQRFKVHRIILRRCAWFERAFFGSFVESDTATVTITNFTPGEVEWLLRRIYANKELDVYSILELNNKFNESGFSSCARIWIISDYFLEADMAAQSLVWLEGGCNILINKSWKNNANQPYIIKDIVAAIRVLWPVDEAGTPYRPQLEILGLVTFISQHIDVEALDVVLKEAPGFAADLCRFFFQWQKEARKPQKMGDFQYLQQRIASWDEDRH